MIDSNFVNLYCKKDKMQKIILVISILLMWFQFFSQSRGDNLGIEIRQGLPYRQVFDSESFKSTDFIAVSLRLEGKDVRDGSFSYKLITNHSTYEFKLHHEWDSKDQDIFVSDILYLDPNEKGTWIFEARNNDAIPKTMDAIGFLRIFIPDSNYKSSLNHRQLNLRNECECPLPEYISRSNWGSSFGLNEEIYIPPPSYTSVTHLIVHHSAGTNISNNWKGVVASIFDAHVHTNGWQDVGYNWLIDPNGMLYEGRGGGDNVIGAHMCSHNKNTLGVCLLGNFNIASPTNEMLEKLKFLLAYKACKESISPIESSQISSYTGFMPNIAGHKDGCAPNHTDCPGQSLYPKLDSIRNIVKIQIDTTCISSSIDEDYKNDSWQIFPIPTFDRVCITTGDAFRIINLEGKEITIPENKDVNNCLDIKDIPSGLYIAQVRKPSKDVAKRFVKY